jgi:hypothetical protein
MARPNAATNEVLQDAVLKRVVVLCAYNGEYLLRRAGFLDGRATRLTDKPREAGVVNLLCASQVSAASLAAQDSSRRSCQADQRIPELQGDAHDDIHAGLRSRGEEHLGCPRPWQRRQRQAAHWLKCARFFPGGGRRTQCPSSPPACMGLGLGPQFQHGAQE